MDPPPQLYTRSPLQSDIVFRLRSLQQYPQLVALDLTFGHEQVQGLGAFRQLLVTCTSLRKLSVIRTDGPQPSTAYFLGIPGSRLPPLTHLKVRGMNVVNCGAPGWEDCIAWDALEHLDCMHASSLPLMPNILTGLRSMTFGESYGIGWPSEHSRAFSRLLIGKSTKLEHLSLTNLIDHIWTQDLVKHEGVPLKSLRIHQEKPNLGSSAGDLSMDYVRNLVKTLSKPLDDLSTIARLFCSLVEVELYVDLRMVGSELQGQVANLANVRRIWNCLWQNMESARKEQHYSVARPNLRTLRVFEGWDQESKELAPHVNDTLRSEYATFEARLCERDDLADKGFADVVCLELEGLRQKRGNAPARNAHTVQHMREMISRAEVGPSNQRKISLGASNHPHLRPLRTPLVDMAEEW
ncbi:MAG: hypothetical protein Q9222_003043 [Ikaeria aurantiellina]